MNKSILLLFACALAGCATGGKKKIALEDVTNEDFKKPAQAKYEEDKDYFKDVDMEEAGALKDESLYRIKDFDASVGDDNDVITQIIYKCYQREFDEAFEAVAKAHDKYRGNPSYWNQVGTCYLLKGSSRKALLFYNKALEFNPGFAPALNNIGVMYRKKGQDQKAEVAFSRAIQSANFSKTPRFNLAQLYLDYGLYKDALGHLTPLERNSGKDVDVLSALGSAYLMAGEYDRSANYFQKINSDHYEKPYIGINAALAFYKTGNKKLARDVLEDMDREDLGPYKKYYEQSAKKVGL
ncbi:MAG: tetratricopeptide repeat protein [Bacteriovoracaceae bacterium]